MNSPIELRQKLIDSVDEQYHVRDMGAIVDVLSTLERLAVTKEVLESTRLGWTVNEFRRKVNNEYLAKRAKNIVKRWRVLVLEQVEQTTRPHNGSGGPSRQQGPTSVNASLLVVGPSSSLSSRVSPSSLLSSKVSPSSSLVSSKVSPCGSPQNSNSSCSFSINNNNPGSSNGNTSLANVAVRNVQQSYGTTSSPTSISASPYVNASTSNKKSPFIGFRNNSNTSPLPQSTNYAPNVEVTSKTNSANKRYREDVNTTIGLNDSESPKAKKARTLVNGSGALDDPLLTFDDISKDSVNSRLSDLSDGSSKLASHTVSSISSAAAAILATQESSNFSPPLAASSISSSGEPLSVTSVINHPVSPSVSFSNSKPVSPDKPKKKRKKRNEVDGIFDTELREKILKAKAEKKDLFRKEESEDKYSSLEPNLELRRIQSAALSPISVKNEIVESYLNSQNQLKAQMQRQAEIIATAPPATSDATDGINRNKLLKGKVKSSKSSESKKKAAAEANLKETSTDPENRLESEAEILSRLPPIDPAILEDFKDFVFYKDPDDPEEDQNSNQNENETDAIVHVKETNKIDWGDSDDDLEPVNIKSREISVNVQQVNNQDHIVSSEISTDSAGIIINTEKPLREVDESEVEQLHMEKIPFLNGNTDKDGNFREWHETLTVDSFKEDVLHILPYTVIDF